MVLHKNKTQVGFIGLGIMGRSMAGHIIDAGFGLHVFNRTKSQASELVGRGAVWHDTPGDVAANCNVIITMVGYPADVEDIYLGDGGILANAESGSYVIDMTTSEPSLAVRIYDVARERGVHSLDAPVSGGEIGALEARLSIMVGGDKENFDTVLPLFELMGENIRLQGSAGAGQHTKMCNQIVVAGNMLATAEGLTYAKRSGLDPEEVLKSIGTGAASSFLLNGLGPKMIEGDFAPGFFVHHFIKDMTIALKESESMGVDLPALKIARDLYSKVADAGAREDGTQALIKAYDS